MAWFGYAYQDCPDSLSFKFYFLLFVVSDMTHPYMFPKAIVSVDVKPIEVKHVAKSDEVNDDVKLSVQSVVVEVDVCA